MTAHFNSPPMMFCDQAGCRCDLPGSPELLLFTEDVARLAGYRSAKAVTVLLHLSRKRSAAGTPWPGDLPGPVLTADRKVNVANRGGGGTHQVTIRDAPQWAWSDIKPWLARRAAAKAGASDG